MADFPEFIGETHPAEVVLHTDEFPTLSPVLVFIWIIEKGIQLLFFDWNDTKAQLESESKRVQLGQSAKYYYIFQYEMNITGLDTK